MSIRPQRSSVFVVLLLLFLNVAAQSSRLTQQPQRAATEDVLSKTKELANEVQASTTNLLQYEKGVSLEVRRGVNRLVKSCLAQELKQPSIPVDSTNDYIGRRVLELNALNTNLSTRLDSLAAVVGKQAEEKCASSLPPFFSSPACIASQELTKTTKSLQSGLASYFALVRSRYQLYRDVSSKEAEGCVKRGFTERLLKANEEHVIEQEELARTKLLELINAADEIYRLQRP
jgi:hypothetical protein